MKKTVTINISGIIFSIDEDAYKKLKIYLDTIKGYFKNSDGRDEIMSDIEARIAEMLQEKISDQKQVVSINDIDEVISLMGQPEDYIDSEDEEFTYEQTRKRRTRRLYRDPDNQVIGGVCSGISHYFGIDPIWIRLALILALFTMGTGVVLYIILWIIIPLAETTSEKLEMKGEPINIDNISKTVEEEMENVKKKFSEIKNKKRSGQAEAQIRNAIGDVLSFIGKVISLLLKVGGKLIGFVLITAGISLILAFFFGVFNPFNELVMIGSSSITGINIFDATPYIFNDDFDSFATVTSLLLLTLVPLAAMIYGGLAFFINFKGANKSIGFSLAGLWFTGWILIFYVATVTTKDFSKEGFSSNEIELTTPPRDTLYLQLSNLPKKHSVTRSTRHGRFLLRVDENNIYTSKVDLDVIRSNDETFKVEFEKTARATSFEEGDTKAENIMYTFVQDSSILSLDPYISFPKEDKIRMQNIRINIKVPQGKTVYLSPDLRYLIDDIQNTTDTYDHRMVGHFWTMTEKGLMCPVFERKNNERDQFEEEENEEIHIEYEESDD